MTDGSEVSLRKSLAMLAARAIFSVRQMPFVIPSAHLQKLNAIH